MAPPATTASVQSRSVPDERAAPAVARSSSVLPATIGSFERSAAAGSVRAIVCGATMSYRGTRGMWMRSRKSSRRTTWLSASRGATSSSQPVGSSGMSRWPPTTAWATRSPPSSSRTTAAPAGRLRWRTKRSSRSVTSSVYHSAERTSASVLRAIREPERLAAPRAAYSTKLGCATVRCLEASSAPGTATLTTSGLRVSYSTERSMVTRSVRSSRRVTAPALSVSEASTRRSQAPSRSWSLCSA